MNKAIERALDDIRPALVCIGFDIHLISISRFGLVKVALYDKGSSSTYKRVKTMLLLEHTIKEKIPGVRVVDTDFI
jgi:hypothetical protein